MFEAAPGAVSRVSELHRLPLAGTRIKAGREARWNRPASGAPSPAPSPGMEAVEAIDREARRLAAREAQCRLVQAKLVAALVKRRLWLPLGFVRLPDYAAERLGMHARSLQEDARVVTALATLPRIGAALGSGAIRWTHARLLASVATPASQDEWLRLALVSTTRRLAELVKAARGRADSSPSVLEARAAEGNPDAGPLPPASSGAERNPDACALPPASSGAERNPDACALPPASSVGSGMAERSPDACALPDAAVCAGTGPTDSASTGSASSAPDEDENADPSVCWRIDVTRAGRRLWRTVGDLASRMCGVDVPASRVAEAVAAEAMSWDVWEPPLAEALPPRAAREQACNESPGDDSGPEASFILLEPDPGLENLLRHVDQADAHEIDRRLRIVRPTMQRINAELGDVLRHALHRNVPRCLGFADIRLYSEIRLGICGSKAMALVRLDRQCAFRSPALLRAYREGQVTWLAATALLPVMSPQHGDAWIRRAGQVTLRRLEAEVGWALDRADDDGGNPRQAPPPLDLDVTADALARCDVADIQMRAHPQTDLRSFGRRVDARIAIAVPASIATMLDDAIEGCRHAIEPRWRGFERILAHAWLTWTALPQRDDTVYARDSYRCQAPGCRNRGRLHAHHVWFRSNGGPDFSWNLTSVCEEHHRAIHRGEIRVHGHAPDRLVWELGCRPGCRPLMRLRGDRFLE